jgi:hypothetical protein
MNDKKIKNKLIKSGIAALVMTSFAFLLTPETSAQYRRGDRREIRAERIESRNIVRIAEAQGYNDGLREGANAIRSRKRYNPYGEKKYRKGTNGYKSRFGNKSTYKRIYRQAFVRGYNDAYYRGNRGVRQNRRGW